MSSMRDIRRSSEASERSIRNIPVHHRKPPAPPRDDDEVEEYEEIPDLPRRRPRRRYRRFAAWAALVVVVCAILGGLLSTVFAGASVTVTPHVAHIEAPASLDATLNGPSGSLHFEQLAVTRSATTTVPAQGTKRVSRAASGVVTITNTYSAEPQRLIANTRFEAADGKIYRIRDSVVVPGMQGTNPGTVTATIYADSPGDTYNKAGSVTFTIPGFKGDPRYTKFAAVSQGGIQGGFVGDEPAVSAEDLAKAKAALQKQLDGDVRSAAAGAIPAGYSAIPGTLAVTYGDLLQIAGPDKTAQLSQTATAHGAIIRQTELASAIARAKVQGYNGEAVSIVEGNLDVQASSTNAANTTLRLAMAGTVTLVWQFDPEALKQALVGKPRGDIEQIIAAFEPAIESADLKLRPFWQNTLPSDPNKISVTVKEPGQ
jgi:hypothetical protein